MSKKRLFDEKGQITDEGRSISAEFIALVSSKLANAFELYDRSDLFRLLSEDLMSEFSRIAVYSQINARKKVLNK